MNRWLIATCCSVCLAISVVSWHVLQTSSPEVLARHAQQIRAQASQQTSRTSSFQPRSSALAPRQTTQPASKPGANTASLPLLDVTLWGTLLEDDPALATAILEEGKSQVLQSYRVGETISGWTLKEIGRGEVILARANTTQRLQLVGQASEPGHASGGRAGQSSELVQQTLTDHALPPHPWLAADQVKELKEAIRPVSDTERVVDREKALNALKNQNPLRVVREASLQPAFAGGRLVGVKLQSVPPDGVLQQSGFQVGDVIQAVDGQPVVDPALVFKLPAKLQQADSVTVRVERNGKPVTLTYRMQ